MLILFMLTIATCFDFIKFSIESMAQSMDIVYYTLVLQPVSYRQTLQKLKNFNKNLDFQTKNHLKKFECIHFFSIRIGQSRMTIRISDFHSQLFFAIQMKSIRVVFFLNSNFKIRMPIPIDQQCTRVHFRPFLIDSIDGQYSIECYSQHPKAALNYNGYINENGNIRTLQAISILTYLLTPHLLNPLDVILSILTIFKLKIFSYVVLTEDESSKLIESTLYRVRRWLK